MRKTLARLGEATILVDQRQLLDHIVVESGELSAPIALVKSDNLHLFSMIRMTPHPGGKPSRRSSAKQSAFNLPSLKVLIWF